MPHTCASSHMTCFVNMAERNYSFFCKLIFGELQFVDILHMHVYIFVQLNHIKKTAAFDTSHLGPRKERQHFLNMQHDHIHFIIFRTNVETVIHKMLPIVRCTKLYLFHSIFCKYLQLNKLK